MRPKADILAEVREAAATGRREVQLLGQIVNHYDGAGRSGVRLQRAARSGARGRRASSGSGSPARIRGTSRRRFLDAMARLPKVCRHLHLPVQSGSTRVLEAMRRRYTRESYLDLVAQIREPLPDVALSTDMIVGFPGETDADFEDTLSLTAAVGYHSMFSFKYSPRPNTLAEQAAARRRAGGRRRRGGSWRCRRCSGEIQSELNEAAGRPRRSTCWSTRRAGGATPSSPAARAATSSSTCRGRRTGSAGPCGCGSSAPGRTACGAVDDAAGPASRRRRRR